MIARRPHLRHLAPARRPPRDRRPAGAARRANRCPARTDHQAPRMVGADHRAARRTAKTPQTLIKQGFSPFPIPSTTPKTAKKLFSRFFIFPLAQGRGILLYCGRARNSRLPAGVGNPDCSEYKNRTDALGCVGKVKETEK